MNEGQIKCEEVIKMKTDKNIERLQIIIKGYATVTDVRVFCGCGYP